MDFFEMDDLQVLMEKQDPLCVSIFIPTEQKGPGQKNQIRFKNALQEAEAQIRALDRRPEDITQLDSAWKLLEEGLFWQNQSHGLAVFASPHIFRTYRVPVEVEELVVAANRFHLKPFLPILPDRDRHFYILALSQNNVRFYRGTLHHIQELTPEGLPSSLSEALESEDEEKQFQFHTRASGTGGDRPAQFHGQGVATDREKDKILRYFRVIDQAIHEILRHDTAPLILAGVEYLFPIFHEATAYPHVLDTGIRGNPDNMSGEELHGSACALFEKERRQNLIRVFARYNDLKGTGKASDQTRQILPGAFDGRVDTLVVARDRQQWGIYDEQSRETAVHQERQPGDVDLLDLAACEALSKDAAVYTAPRTDLPDGASLIALFRY